MSFSQSLWNANQALFQSTLELPFNQELAAGTLSRERFCHYMIQDAHYLVAYGRALAVTAAKSDNAEGVVQFANAANEAVVVERALHGGFMRDFGVTPEQYAESLDLPKLFTAVMELVTDDAFLDFLSSSETGKDAGAPGSASASFEVL